MNTFHRFFFALLCCSVLSVFFVDAHAFRKPQDTPQGAPKHVVDIQHWTSSNGARVYFVAAKDLPILDVKVVFDAGSARDADKPGLAYFVNQMLREGTEVLDGDQVAQAFEEVGAKFSTHVGRDMSIASLRTLTEKKNLDQALHIFKQVISKPVFPEREIKRLKKQVSQEILQQKDSVTTTANNAFYALLYKKHPYAHPIIGLNGPVQTIDATRLKAFYDQYYVARNAIVVLVGNLGISEAKRIADKVTEDLAEGQSAPALPVASNLKRGEEQPIFFASTQSAIRIGQVGISRHHPDYFPLLLGNHILGSGGLVSRLNHEVREKRALTYSVYSYFDPLAARGPFLITLETRQSQADAALKVVKDVLTKFIVEGPTLKELEASKKNLIGSFGLNLDSNQSITDYLVVIGFYKLPLDYLDTFVSKVQAVSREAIMQAFEKQIKPERMLTIKTVTKNTQHL